MYHHMLKYIIHMLFAYPYFGFRTRWTQFKYIFPTKHYTPINTFELLIVRSGLPNFDRSETLLFLRVHPIHYELYQSLSSTPSFLSETTPYESWQFRRDAICTQIRCLKLDIKLVVCPFIISQSLYSHHCPSSPSA